MRLNPNDTYSLIENHPIFGRKGRTISGSLYRELSDQHKSLFFTIKNKKSSTRELDESTRRSRIDPITTSEYILDHIDFEEYLEELNDNDEDGEVRF